MKTRSSVNIIYILALSLLLPVSGSYAYSDKTKSIKVSKGGKLEASVNYGNYTVKTWEKDELMIRYDSDSEIEITQRGNTVVIESDDYSDEADFEITAPSSFNFDLNTSGGNIDFLNNITGNTDCNTAGGNINIENVNGNARLNTAGGNITAGAISGNADMNSGGGEIKISSITGMCEVNTGGGNIGIGKVSKSLEANTGGGNITISDIGGMADVTTGGGNIILGKVTGSLSVATGGGNINIKGTDGDVEASTGGGNIVLNNISGSVSIHSGAGDLEVHFNSVGMKESELMTGMGDIEVFIPGNAKADISVEVNYMGWSSNEEDTKDYIESDFKASDFDFNQKKGKIRAEYKLNGGGPEIRIRTSMGKVLLRKIK